jgi:hypothetical protein
MWNKAVVALFKVKSRNFSGGTQENHEKKLRIVSIEILK